MAVSEMDKATVRMLLAAVFGIVKLIRFPMSIPNAQIVNESFTLAEEFIKVGMPEKE